MGKLRNCSRCGTETDTFCPTCLEWFDHQRPDPAKMLSDERAREMCSWTKVEIPFDKIHQRIEELVGRPVWTHEMGLNWDGLVQEARGRPCKLDMDCIPNDKTVIGVVVPEGESR